MEEEKYHNQNEINNDISDKIRKMKGWFSTIKDKSTNDENVTPDEVTKKVFDIVTQLSKITSTFLSTTSKEEDSKMVWEVMNKVVYPVEMDDQIYFNLLRVDDNPHFIQENKQLTELSRQEDLSREKIESFGKFFDDLLTEQESKMRELEMSFKGSLRMEEE